MLEKIVERTDFSEPRLVAATKSLIRFHEFETDRLTALKRGCNEELERHPENIEVRDELQRADNELRDLQTGWQNSSMRNRLLKSSSEQADSNRPLVEKRLLVSASETLLPSRPRTEGGGRPKKLRGYASVFGKNSMLLAGSFIEQVAPNAFDGVLEKSDARALFNHSADLLLGRQSSGTLRLYADSKGLEFVIDLIAGDSLSESMANRVQRGDIRGASFSFVVGRDRWVFSKEPGGTDLRIIEKIDQLYDIAPCTWPAYPDTTVDVEFEQKRSEPKQKTVGNTSGYEFALDDDDEGLASIIRLRRARESLAELDYKRAGRILDRCKTQLS